MAVSLVATAVMTSVFSMRVICWTSKPGSGKGMWDTMAPLAKSVEKNFLIFLYELGLYPEHGRCGRPIKLGQDQVGVAQIQESKAQEVWLIADGSDLCKPYAQEMP